MSVSLSLTELIFIEYPLITIAGGISEGIFTADSRELNIHPIALAQAD